MNLLGKRFKIEDDLIGFGSFGRTFMGKDIVKNKNVAIKIVCFYTNLLTLIIDAKKESF